MDESKEPVSKSLFERSYKSIRFIKGKETNESNGTSESIADFYRNLPQEKSQPIVVLKQEKDEKEQEKEKPSSVRISDNKNLLFKAIEAHDIEYVKRYLNEDYDPFVEDDFKWNVIMMAVSSSANEILTYLLENITDESRLFELIGSRDQAGNTVDSLAKKFHNKQALEIIDDFRHKRSKESNEIPVIDGANDASNSSSYHCRDCKSIFNQSREEHLKSIVHQLNDPERTSETAISGKNHLKSDNKGYQLLIKSGWNETTGLGINEQGVRNPITGKVKLNRTGIGIDKKKAQTQATLSLRNVRLKTNNDGGDKSSLKSYRKSQRKSKVFEMKLRRYFNS